MAPPADVWLAGRVPAVTEKLACGLQPCNTQSWWDSTMQAKKQELQGGELLRAGRGLPSTAASRVNEPKQQQKSGAEVSSSCHPPRESFGCAAPLQPGAA